MPRYPRTCWLAVGASLMVLAVPAAVAWQVDAPQHASERAAEQRPLAEVPFDFFGGKIFVPVVVNGKGPYSFAFDTGCSIAAIDARVADEVGLKPFAKYESRGAGEGAAASAWLSDVHVTLAGMKASGSAGTHIHLNEIVGPTTGRRLDGLVGNELAFLYTVEIDYPARMLRLFDRDSYEYHGPGRVVPVTVPALTMFEATITPARVGEGDARPPIRGQFALDTGSRGGVSFTTHFVNRHHLLEKGAATLEAVVGHGVGGPVRHRVGRIDSLTIAGCTLPSLVADFSQDARGIFRESRFAGIIGARVLSRFTLILDYARSRIILVPGPVVDAPDRFDCSGLWLETPLPDFRRFIVRSVVPGSAAARAGLVENDEIMSADGKPFSEWTFDSLTELFRTPGRTVPVTVLRGGETIEAQLELRPQV